MEKRFNLKKSLTKLAMIPIVAGSLALGGCGNNSKIESFEDKEIETKSAEVWYVDGNYYLVAKSKNESMYEVYSIKTDKKNRKVQVEVLYPFETEENRLEKMMKDSAYRMLHNLQTESGSENFNLDDYISREAERLKNSYIKE